MTHTELTSVASKELMPPDWTISTLGQEVSSIIGGGTPSKNVPEYWGGVNRPEFCR